MNSVPILSICIPTYNRGYILKHILHAYVNNPEFNEDVELVISDNCSTDDTQQICLYYASLKNNIRYYRNKKNIHDRNFSTVLNYANGQYLKLTNDWAYYDKEGLAFIKEKLRFHMEEKRPVFFTTGVVFTKRKAEVIICNNLDDYVAAVSTYVTYNNIFGVWKEQWQHVEEKQKYSSLKLQQVDWTYQIVLRNEGCIIYDKECIKYSPVERKIWGGYNWFEIHLNNYYTIMKPYIMKGAITRKTYIRDKHYLLKHFKPEFRYSLFYNYNKKWQFESKGTWALLWKYYKYDPYIIVFLFLLTPSYLRHLIKYYLNNLKNA